MVELQNLSLVHIFLHTLSPLQPSMVNLNFISQETCITEHFWYDQTIRCTWGMRKHVLTSDSLNADRNLVNPKRIFFSLRLFAFCLFLSLLEVIENCLWFWHLIGMGVFGCCYVSLHNPCLYISFVAISIDFSTTFHYSSIETWMQLWPQRGYVSIHVNNSTRISIQLFQFSLGYFKFHLKQPIFYHRVRKRWCH